MLKYFLLFICIAILGCQTSRPQAPSSGKDSGPNGGINTPIITPQATTTAPSATPIQLPQFVSKRTPKVGLILGPGGAKVLAHIGVLQELERNKIPVAAIAGLEWGSLPASLYALHQQSHEVDWKMSQWPTPPVKGKTLFNKKWGPISIQEYDSYLQKIFQQSKIENFKIPFACPVIYNKRMALYKKGLAASVIKPCLQFPPMFEIKDAMAAPFAVRDVADFLRAQGAELLILVNVLNRFEMNDFQDWESERSSWLHWVAVQESLNNAKFFGVHETINMDLSAFNMVEVDQRLRLIQVGKQGSADAIDRIVKKYDF